MTIEERIKEIAVQQCGEYPGVEKVDSWQHLWAIESTIKGFGDACDDWFETVKLLQQWFGITDEKLLEAFDMAKKLNDSNKKGTNNG